MELFVRSRQGMQPTLPALQFLKPARAMHSAMHRLSLGAAGKDAHVQGVVRISVSVSLAHFVLPELLDVFRSQHEGIRFEITATDSVSNLSQREADIAIRLVQPEQKDLIAKRVGYLSTGLYASQRYLSRHGVPKMETGSLMQHDLIDVAPQNPLREGFSKAGFAHGGVAVEVDVFMLDAPPKPLHKDVVIRPAPAVHADGNALTLKWTP